jgi:hypothetical protein
VEQPFTAAFFVHRNSSFDVFAECSKWDVLNIGQESLIFISYGLKPTVVNKVDFLKLCAAFIL